MPCEAIVQTTGTSCKNRAIITRGGKAVCGTHHKSLLKSDATYRNTYNAALETERQAEQRAKERETNKKQRAYERTVAGFDIPAVATIVWLSKHILNLWYTHRLPAYDIPKAYAVLRNSAFHTDTYKQLLRATGIFYATLQRDGYSNITEAARNEHMEAIRQALVPYEDVNLNVLQSDDGYWMIRERQRQDEEQRRREEEAHRLQEEELARRAAFEQRLRQEPVIFHRDPDGGIDLRAFATDTQNIHRSSVQSTTEKSVHMILIRSVPTGQDTLAQIHAAWVEERLVRFSTDERRELALLELTNDYFNTQAFSVNYGDVLDRVWAFIHASEHRKALCVRLAQEVSEGRGMCTNGKMARLVNVLQGFDESLSIGPSEEVMKLMFQSKIAKVAERPLEERQAAAESLFTEFNIPEEERSVWLQPLLEV